MAMDSCMNTFIQFGEPGIYQISYTSFSFVPWCEIVNGQVVSGWIIYFYMYYGRQQNKTESIFCHVFHIIGKFEGMLSNPIKSFDS